MATDVTKLVLAVDSRQVKKATKNVDELGKKGVAVKKTFVTATSAIAAFAGALALGAAFKSVLSATIAQEEAVAQLNATLRSTGRYTPELSASMVEYAASLQKITTFGDEATMSAQAMLLTFTRIGGDEFTRAQKAVLDVATAMKTDLKSAAIQVGKALNDPKVGLTALSRSGITFSETQKDLIKSLVDTGKEAEAQAVILSELEKQFGGSAEAARNTLGGSLKALGNAFGDLTEGKAGGSGIKGATEAIEELTAKLSDQQTIDNAFVLINGLITGFGQVTEAISQTVEFTQWLSDSFAASIFGVAADDVERLEDKVQDLKVVAEGNFWGFSGKAKEELAIAQKQLDMAYQIRAMGQKPTERNKPLAVPVVSGADTITTETQKAAAAAKKLGEEWDAVYTRLNEQVILGGLSGMELEFAKINIEAAKMVDTYGEEYEGVIDNWVRAMRGFVYEAESADIAAKKLADSIKKSEESAASIEKVEMAMEELTFATMTASGQEESLIIATRDRLNAMARQMAMLGEISESTADAMQKVFGEKAQADINKIGDTSKTFMEQLRDGSAEWAKSYASTMNEMLWSSETTFDGILESFGKMITELLLQSAILDLVGNGKDGGSGTSGLLSQLGNFAVSQFSTASAAGGYDIPSGVNPMTQLHEEEMVLPAKYANAIRDMSGGGGATPQTAPKNDVRIINVQDMSQVGDYLGTTDGEQVVMNILQKNGIQ